MTQDQKNHFTRLRAAVEGLPSGSSLIASLESEEAPCLPHSLAELFAKVIDEARCRPGNAPQTTLEPVARLSLADATSVVRQLMFVVPRGKQDIAFRSDDLVIQTSKHDVVVPYTAIQNIIILDKIPKDTKGRVLLYLHLDQGAKIMNGKVALKAVVIQVLADQQLSMGHPTLAGQRIEQSAAVALCQAFGCVGVSPMAFCSPDPSCFASSDGNAGVEAYVKARQGFLYPLPAGLCFLESPAMFVSRADIRAVELARATGASSTFDLYVHCGGPTGRTTIEFSNISRNEIASIEGWIRVADVAVGPTASSAEEEDSDAAENGKDAGAGGYSSSDDSQDEDFAPSESEVSGARKGKKRSRKEKQNDADGEAKGKVVNRKRGLRDDHDDGADGGEEASRESEHESEHDSDSSESSEDDSDESGSVELVSEDEFSMGALRNMMEAEKRTRVTGGDDDDA